MLAAISFATLAHAADAVMYRWTNDDGTQTYSNQPPPDPAAIGDLTVIVPPTPAIEVRPLPPKTPEENAAAERDSESAARISSVRSKLPQAVQDPCLTSPDPLCPQKNAAHYRPYIGYTPEVNVTAAPVAVPPARGVTSGAAAGGTLSGGTRPK